MIIIIHIFSFIYLIFHEYISNWQYNQFPVDLKTSVSKITLEKNWEIRRHAVTDFWSLLGKSKPSRGQTANSLSLRARVVEREEPFKPQY